MTDPTKNNKQVRVGFPWAGDAAPRLVYFELFEGEHPSKKIYSVQRNDWSNFMLTAFADRPGYPLAAWEVDEESYKEQANKLDHLRVKPTRALRAFMESRGIDLPEYVYVQPRAFEISRQGFYRHQPETIVVEPPLDDEWLEYYFDIVYDTVNFQFADGTQVEPDSTASKSNKGKVLLAALVAAISLLK